ncbi:MAG: SLC13 family permease [Pseudomonadota bacterium]
MSQAVLVSLLLLGTLALFMWGRWRHDVVAFFALVVALLLGVVPIDQAFVGFSHPAVVTVALVLVLSWTLDATGVIEGLARRLATVAQTRFANLAVLTGIGTAISGFMNNVGALAVLMPLAMRTAREPSRVLMPLSFATLLGGMLTEIGTPPNIIIAAYRRETTGEAFHLFDFTPVGAVVALVGLIYLVTVGWRLIPKRRHGTKQPVALLKGVGYISEVLVPGGSKSIGKPVRLLERAQNNETIVVGMIRNNQHLLGNIRSEILEEGDLLIVRAEQSALLTLVNSAELEFLADAHIPPDSLGSEDVVLMEVVVRPRGRLERRTARNVGLHRLYGINLLAIARHGARIKGRIGHTVLMAGDVLLVQGEKEGLQDTMMALGCLPLAQQNLRPPRAGPRWLSGAIFALAILSVMFGILAIEVALAVAVLALVVLKVIQAREVYEAIDWSVVVLLGALIPLGTALESSGVTIMLSEGLLSLTDNLPLWMLLGLLVALTMVLTNLINNAATAVVMGPFAVAMAHGLGVSIDPFLMAVAIGASCAFLTPFGHQNNVLVMSAGGYRFGDYWRIGLPLQLLALVLAVPLILLFWPL